MNNRLWQGMFGMCLMIAVATTARAETLLSDTFDGTNGSEITTLGWTQDNGASTGKLYVDNTWAINSEGGSYTAKGDVAKDGNWVTYSKNVATAYTLGANDVVTATITYRSGRGVTNKLAMLTNAGAYAMTRLITDTDTGYNCYEPSSSSSLGYASMGDYWWSDGLLHGASYFKIVATQSSVKFYYKDAYNTSWTLLGTSSTGITTFNGIEIGGMVATDAANTYIQFDTLNVEVTQAEFTSFAETFDGTNGNEITALGWTQDTGASTGHLYINNDWAIDTEGGSYTAKGDMLKDGNWVTYYKNFDVAYTLNENDVVTATISFRSDRDVTDKFALLTDAGSFMISRLMTTGNTGYNCYTPAGSNSLGYASMYAYWWQSGVIGGASYLKIVGTRSKVQFYYKDPYITSWRLLGTSTVGINQIQGVQIGGMLATDASSTYVQFDTVNVSVTQSEFTSFTETFDGTNGTGITSLGWVQDTGASTGHLYISNEWGIDTEGGSYTAKGDMAKDGNWVNYSDIFATPYTLTDKDIVTATVTYRSGRGVTNQYALLTDTGSYSITRLITDTDTGYNCYEPSNNTSLAYASMYAYWWQSGVIGGASYFKIVGTRNGVSFYYKDAYKTSWTLLGASTTGINKIKGVQIGGMVAADAANTYVQFDTVSVTISKMQASAPVFTPVVDNIRPSASTISGPTDIAITSATTGASIYYTTDGITTPTTSSKPYTGPVTVTNNMTLQAIAVASNYTNSDVTSVTYSVPDFNGPATIYNGTATVNGNLSEWSNATWTPMTVDYNSVPTDITSASYAVRWSAEKVYMAVKVQDASHYLSDDYWGWNTQDGLELYIHTNGVGDASYPNCEIAQQYSMGLQSGGQSVWTIFGNNSMYPSNMMTVPGNLSFEAAGSVSGEWLYYEIAMTPFEFCGAVSGKDNVISSLQAGDIIGIDVIVTSANSNGTYTGMKCENNKTAKAANWNQFGVHKLATGIAGDFNNDYVVNATDIDLLSAAIKTTNPDLKFDLTGEGSVNSADMDMLIKDILKTYYGDADLNGSVGVSDLSVLAAYYNTPSGASWANGDFDGNGAVGVSDLSILAANYNSGSASTVSWAEAYAQAFGTTSDAETSSDEATADEEDTSSTICSSLGLSLIAGLALMGLMIVKMEE
jgi:hypothetical protein